MVENRQTTIPKPTLPSNARLPINRCNVPSVILGSLIFQLHPIDLVLDGVYEIHEELFKNLSMLDKQQTRIKHFKSYMDSSFLLEHPEEAGFEVEQTAINRTKADYLKLLRGWFFNSNSREGAVLKNWVESRFGLLARSHNGLLADFDSKTYVKYQAAYSQGLYNTNGLEAQIDLLFSYCQYELKLRYQTQHIVLYRGTNHLEEYEIIKKIGHQRYSVLLNNVNSFTDQQERADEFGDYILSTKVPLSKIVYFPGLLPSVLQGESEFVVLGGVYDVEINS